MIPRSYILLREEKVSIDVTCRIIRKRWSRSGMLTSEKYGVIHSMMEIDASDIAHGGEKFERGADH